MELRQKIYADVTEPFYAHYAAKRKEKREKEIIRPTGMRKFTQVLNFSL
jgi:hypothetical protein